MTADAPRRLRADRDLLDLQIVDTDARPVGKVDDLELRDDGGRLIVAAILVGVPALAGRFKSWFGRWMRSTYRRLHEEARDDPVRIDFDRIRHLNSRVDLSVPRDRLGIGAADEWLVETWVARVPGSDHAPQ